MAIVVTGATGNVGRPLVTELVRAGAEVRAVSRDPARAGLPADVEVSESVIAALPGATAVFLNSRALGPGLADSVRHARDAGVAKFVALAAINCDDEDARQPSRFRGDRNRETEQAAVESGLSWVSLRPAVFATNFAGMWAGQIRMGDVIAGPYARASSAPIAEADIAAVAAHALLTDDLDGQRVPMTGPQALTNTELVHALAGVLGRPLRYVEADPAVVRDRFTAIGFPAEFADAYIAMQAAAVEHPALVGHDVEKILGRPAQPFAEWAAQHTELFN
jgi:uncharacterized protein YbjT (DUF2867 family)